MWWALTGFESMRESAACAAVGFAPMGSLPPCRISTYRLSQKYAHAECNWFVHHKFFSSLNHQARLAARLSISSALQGRGNDSRTLFIVQTPHYSILLSDNKTQEGPLGRWRKAEGQRQYLSTGAPVERETKTNWICSLRRGANIMVLSSRCAGLAVRPDKANCLSNLWCCKTAWNRGGEEGSSPIPVPFQVPMSQTASLATHVAVIG